MTSPEDAARQLWDGLKKTLPCLCVGDAEQAEVLRRLTHAIRGATAEGRLQASGELFRWAVTTNQGEVPPPCPLPTPARSST